MNLCWTKGNLDVNITENKQLEICRWKSSNGNRCSLRQEMEDGTGIYQLPVVLTVQENTPLKHFYVGARANKRKVIYKRCVLRTEAQIYRTSML